MFNTTSKGLNSSKSKDGDSLLKKAEIQIRNLKSIQDQNEFFENKTLHQLLPISSTPKGMHLGLGKASEDSNNSNISKRPSTEFDLAKKIQSKDSSSNFNRTPKFNIKS